MANLNGVLLAIELATKQRNVLQSRLAMSERHNIAVLRQMEQLRSYADDKDSAWVEAAPGVFSGELIRHHYQFIGRLQQAMGMQAEVLGQAKVQVGEARAVLANAEIRLESLKRILKSRTSAKDLWLKRRDQKQTDDFASQQYARKRSEAEQGEVK